MWQDPVREVTLEPTCSTNGSMPGFPMVGPKLRRRGDWRGFLIRLLTKMSVAKERHCTLHARTAGVGVYLTVAWVGNGAQPYR